MSYNMNMLAHYFHHRKLDDFAQSAQRMKLEPQDISDIVTIVANDLPYVEALLQYGDPRDAVYYMSAIAARSPQNILQACAKHITPDCAAIVISAAHADNRRYLEAMCVHREPTLEERYNDLQKRYDALMARFVKMQRPMANAEDIPILL